MIRVCRQELKIYFCIFLGEVRVREECVYRYEEALVGGVIERREKRFFAYCRLDSGEEVVAHCPNPGSMKGVLDVYPSRVWLSRVRNPKAKLAWRLEIVETKEGVGIGVHTTLANRVVEEALRRDLIPELRGYDEVRREVKYDEGSRIDFLLEGEGGRVYVEVKSVTMCRGDREEGHGLKAEFPDSQTTRGLKHLEALSRVVGEGVRSVVLYVVQRGDCECVGIAGDVDKKFEEAMKDFWGRDEEKKIDLLEVLCYSCRVTREGIVWGKRLPLLMR